MQVRAYNAPADAFAGEGENKMKKEKPFAGLDEVWKRMEKSRGETPGSAMLKPRLAPGRRTNRFVPPCR